MAGVRVQMRAINLAAKGLNCLGLSTLHLVKESHTLVLVIQCIVLEVWRVVILHSSLQFDFWSLHVGERCNYVKGTPEIFA